MIKGLLFTPRRLFLDHDGCLVAVGGCRVVMGGCPVMIKGLLFTPRHLFLDHERALAGASKELVPLAGLGGGDGGPGEQRSAGPLAELAQA